MPKRNHQFDYVIYKNDNEYKVIVRIRYIASNKYYPEGVRYSYVLLKNRKRILGYDNYERQGHHKHENKRFSKNTSFIDEFNLLSRFQEEVNEMLKNA